MRKIFVLTAILSGAVISFSCQKSAEIPSEKEDQAITKTFTCIWDSPINSDTKVTLANDGKTGWEVGDVIFVHANKGSNGKDIVLGVTEGSSVSADGKTATFTVTLTDVPADGDYPVEYNYPSVPNGYDVISGQDGTLATLQSTFDRASGSGTMNVSGGIVTLPNITMSNKMAILAIKLLNSSGTSTITQTISKLDIEEYPKVKPSGNITTNQYHVEASSGNFGDDVIYVAVWPTQTDAQYWVTAYTKNGSTYTQSHETKKLTSRNYTAGNFYNIGWKLTAK